MFYTVVIWDLVNMWKTFNLSLIYDYFINKMNKINSTKLKAFSRVSSEKKNENLKFLAWTRR